LRLTDILLEHPQYVKKLKTTLIDMTHVFSVMEMVDGEIFIETEEEDEDHVITIEVLRNNNQKYFTLIHRQRFGASPMKSYERDYRFPLYSKIRLNGI
jgi:hypothetical protein